MLKKINLSRIFFGIIFCVILYFHLESVNRKFTGRMYPREIQTADIARNLSEDFNIIKPQVKYLGPINKYVILEFPAYQIIVSFINKLFNADILISGRIVSIFLSLLGLLGIYLILSLNFSKDVVFFSMAFFLTLSVNIIIATAVQPDVLMFTCLIWVYYFAELNIKYKNYFVWFLFSLASFIAIFSKLNVLIILIIPALFLPIIIDKNLKIILLKISIWGFIVIVPFFLWRMHSIKMYAMYPNSTMISSYKEWFDPFLFFSTEDFNWYLRFWDNLKFCFLSYNTLIGAITLLLILIGIFSIIKEKKYLPLIFIISLIFYILVFNLHSATHYYYLLPMTLCFTLVFSYFLDLFKYKFIFLCISIYIATLLFNNIKMIKQEYAINSNSEYTDLIIPKIHEIVSDDALIVVSSFYPMKLLFNLNRYGWILDLNRLDYAYINKIFKTNKDDFTEYLISSLDLSIKEGAKYYIVTNINLLKKEKEFLQYLLDKYPIAFFSDNIMVIFSLQYSKQ